MPTSMGRVVATPPSATAATSTICTMVISTIRTKVMSTSHVFDVSHGNPDAFTSDHRCGGHEPGHVHGPGGGHEAVPHGDHTDYHVSGHLHYPHGGHRDDHGPLTAA
jgi:hypothetical protein